jgi:hypothetical protein
MNNVDKIILGTKLSKLLNLSTSDNDAEALSAIRMANTILKGEGLGWVDMLLTPPGNKIPLRNTPAPTETSKKKYDGEDVAHMLDECKGTFIDSLRDWYDSKGFLTAKQYESLLKAYKDQTK